MCSSQRSQAFKLASTTEWLHLVECHVVVKVLFKLQEALDSYFILMCLSYLLGDKESKRKQKFP